MKLDRHTYEAWLLDRIEGNLTAGQLRELDAFLAANPDLPVDLGPLPTIAVGSTPGMDRDLLKRDQPPLGAITPQNLTDHLIARLEGDLNEQALNDLARYLYEHPEAAHEAALVEATRSAAGNATWYDRDQLYRHYPPVGMPDLHRMDDFLVARMEGGLDPAQVLAVETLISSRPEWQRAAALMAHARMQHEPIHFPFKALLRKKEGRLIAFRAASHWTLRLAAAASIALLLGLGWWALQRPDLRAPGQVAVKAPGSHPVETVAPAEVRTEEVEAAQEEEGPVHEGPAKAQDSSRNSPREQRAPVIVVPDAIGLPTPTEEFAQVEAPAPIPSEAQDAAPEAPLLAGSTPSPGRAAPEAVTNDPMRSTFTVGEFVANAMRTRILKKDKAAPRALDGSDALDLADAGLKAVSSGQAGLTSGSDGRRLSLRLGRALTVTASR